MFIFNIYFNNIYNYGLIVLGILCIILWLIFLFSWTTNFKDNEKLSSYECGFEPFDDTRNIFDIQFYLIAIIFLIFDLEIIFLYTWSFNLNYYTNFEFFKGICFFFFIILTYIYEYKENAFDWKKTILINQKWYLQLFFLNIYNHNIISTWFFICLCICLLIYIYLTNNIMLNVLALIVIFIGNGALLINMNADILGLYLIIIYAGAITVVILFVIMFTNFKKLNSTLNIQVLFFKICLFISLYYIYNYFINLNLFITQQYILCEQSKYIHIISQFLALFTKKYDWILLNSSILLLLGVVGPNTVIQNFHTKKYLIIFPFLNIFEPNLQILYIISYFIFFIYSFFFFTSFELLILLITYNICFLFFNVFNIVLLLINILYLSLLIFNLYNFNKIELQITNKISLLLFIYLTNIELILNTQNLFAIFLNIESISLILFILLISSNHLFASIEIAIKYFIQNAFLSCILLLGILLLFKEWNTVNLYELYLKLHYYNNKPSKLHCIALICIISTFLFKLSIVPFHFWTADIYAGTSLFLTQLFAIINKFFFFIIFLKIFYYTQILHIPEILLYIKVTSFCSIIIGSISLIFQTNIKRFLAYSTINNMGFILFPLSFCTTLNQFNIFYFSINFFFYYNIVLFLIFLFLNTIYLKIKKNYLRHIYYFTDLTNFSNTNKLLTYLISLYLLALSGIPPLTTFYPKYMIYTSILNNTFSPIIIIILIITTIITTIYYFNLIKIINFDIKPFQKITFIVINFQFIYIYCFLLLLLFVLKNIPLFFF